MGNAVDNNWEMILSVNAAIQQENRAYKQNDSRSLQRGANAQTNRVSILQQVERDVIVSADRQVKQQAQSQVAGEVNNSKPILPSPGINWNAFQGVGGDEPGLISIIAAALCKQAITNSRFWTTMWKQATASMLVQVKFAPLIGRSIRDAYNAQAEATQAQADQSKWDGIVSLGMFAGAVGMAAFSEVTDEQSAFSKLKNNNRVGYEEEGEEAATGIGKTGEEDNLIKTDEDEAEQIEEANKQLNKDDESYAERAKKTGSFLYKKFQDGQKIYNSWLAKLQTPVSMMSMLEKGATGLIDSKYQGKQATMQGIEGKAQALSKEAEQYAQYYGQDFSRDEDLRQGAGQSLQDAMKTLESAAQSITQTSISMFRQ